MTVAKKEIINAFHPDYVKTYHPDFIEYFRLLTIHKKCGDSMTKALTNIRKTNKNHGTIHGLGNK